MNILLAEDMPEMASLLCETLVTTYAALNIVWRQNGQYALEEFVKRQEIDEGMIYDCVITDMQMPIMNGVEFALAVKKISDTPIFLWSGNQHLELREDLFVRILVKDNLRFWTDEFADYCEDLIGDFDLNKC